MNMKRLIISLVALASVSCFAAPHFGPRPMPRPMPRPVHHYGPRIPPPHHHHHYHYNPGPAFVGGLVGGLVGSAIVETVRPTPVIVATPPPQPTVIIQNPTIVPRQVWIEGKYVQQIVNGTTVNVWVPGHWETVYQ